MNAIQAELAIKGMLDGTFTRVGPFGEISVEVVPVDYDPFLSSKERRAAAEAVPWTPEDDEALIQARRLGRPYREAAWLVGRSENAAKMRYRILAVERGLTR